MTTIEPLTDEGMQAEHRLWDHEHSVWRVHFARWLSDHDLMFSELVSLQQVVRQHRDAIEGHVRTLEKHQQRLCDHNRALAELMRESGAPIQAAMQADHVRYAKRHNELRATCDRIEKHHHSAMTHLAALRAAIEAAME